MPRFTAGGIARALTRRKGIYPRQLRIADRAPGSGKGKI